MKILIVITLLVQTFALYDTEVWTTNEVDLGNGGDTLFYYLFKARNAANRDKRLIIWLSGGPGCSSNAGLLMENGPYFLNVDQTLTYNFYSWNTDYDIVFVDQPVGTGYANVKDKEHYCTNETCVASNFYRFMVRFVELYHPEYKGKPLYLTGESYGGHYVPTIAEYILKANNPMINLTAIAIGNGLTDMSIQFDGYAKYLNENNLIRQSSYIYIKLVTSMCHIALIYRTTFSDLLCLSALEYLQTFSGFVNPYDIRRNTTDGDKMKAVGLFMANKTVQEIYGIKNYKNVSELCSDEVGEYMIWDFCSPFVSSLEYILGTHTRVLIYHGDKDYICNWRGGELLANSASWEGQSTFLKTPYKNFTYQGKTKGQFRKHSTLTFLRIFDAGHMVPMDQSEVALHMLRNFLDDKEWDR